MPPKILLLSVLILFTSCVKDVDFDQSDDLFIQPKYVASLVHFTFDKNKFMGYPDNLPIVFPENFSAPLNTSTIGNEYLTRAEILFEVSNTLNRAVVLTVQCSNLRGTAFSFRPIMVPPNTPKFSYLEIITRPRLSDFFSSDTAEINVLLYPVSSTISNPNPQINVQISGTFYFNFNY